MGAVNTAMERAVGETGLSLESQMILLATAVSSSRFLGLLGAIWGVMDAFTGVAARRPTYLQVTQYSCYYFHQSAPVVSH
jgi:biopolymer transport protein ExbB/TolQ